MDLESDSSKSQLWHLLAGEVLGQISSLSQLPDRWEDSVRCDHGCEASGSASDTALDNC